ncbi:YwaF family protein [Paenibacillus urinalis]|uniref:YwaF family protein n=1 Tax=Paenibacillus urinalis TaxID=521520 RepID=UPI003639D219
MHTIVADLSIFNPYNAPRFEFMSLAHAGAVAVIIVLLLAMFMYRQKLRNSVSARKILRCILLSLLILSQLMLEVWYQIYDLWDPAYTLPLELCSITLLLSCVMLVTRNRVLYIIVFYAGICGALAALLTPDLVYTFPHFRFIQFFIAHGSIIAAALYMTWIEQVRLTITSVPLSMLLLNLIAGIVWCFNQVFGANYMFLSHKPESPSILDMLGPYPYYILVEEWVAFVLFTMMYILFFYLPSRASSKTVSKDHVSL